MNRREFSRRMAGTAVVAGFPAFWPAAGRTDVSPDRRAGRAGVGRLILKGGLVYDGNGTAPVEADVAIENDRIAAVGRDLSGAGIDTLDIRGLAVSPGFIDIHSHTDLSLLINPNAESKVRQGVTTEVVGQDGDSVGPWSDGVFEETRDRYRERYGVLIDFRHLAEFFTRLEINPASVNLASMVGAGTVREFVIGSDQREATEDELELMSQLVASALDAGACGLSSGLEYIPSAFADTDELIRLALPLVGTGLPYATHMRNEDDRLFAAVEEALHVARMAGVPVQLSHLKALGRRNWWKPDALFEMIETAANDGLDVNFDRYPYVAYSTTLASLFPVWSREGGTDQFIARLENPDDERRIRVDVQAKIDRIGNWNSVQITAAAEDSLEWVNGQRLGDLASSRGVDPYSLTKQIVISDRNRTNMVGFGMSEANTERFLAHSLGMICSDAGARAPYGPLSTESPHPRAYGSFPRVLGHYCRDRQIMPLETAIMKMTSMPADRIGLRDRGRLKVGMSADLVVFDPATVADRATFADPHQYPIGIEYVFVNGAAVVNRGQHTEMRVGRVLRPQVT